MKLVIHEVEYISGKCKGVCHIPIEYESKRAVKKIFAHLAKKQFNKYYTDVDNRLFKFCGHFFNSHDFYYKFTNNLIKKIEVNVYTLEEWFDKFHTKVKKSRT